GKVIAEATCISHSHRISLAAFDRSRDCLPADGGFDDLVDLSDAQVVPGGLLTLDLIIDVVAAGDALKECAARALDALQCPLHLQTDIPDGFELRPHHFDPDRRTNAGRDHV